MQMTKSEPIHYYTAAKPEPCKLLQMLQLWKNADIRLTIKISFICPFSIGNKVLPSFSLTFAWTH